MRRLRRGLLLLALLLSVASCSDDDEPSGPAGDPCGTVGTVVSDADGLSDALSDAGPGDRILLAAGTYDGQFTAASSGTSADPITLCGDRGAVLDGGSVEHGYTLHLDGASYWHLVGFSVTGGQKGVMLDGAEHNVLTDLRISGVGDEALHLRDGSSNNRVEANVIGRTGLREPAYGEGIYVGSAESNWCDISDCDPDHSDHNVLTDNQISHTSAEAIDVKEGTTGGVIRDNELRGPDSDEADSVIDLKGNGWVVSGNRVASTAADGIQVHVVIEGWGERNRIVRNSFELTQAGYAVHVVGAAEHADNVVGCHQRMTPSGVGEPSNVPCR